LLTCKSSIKLHITKLEKALNTTIFQYSLLKQQVPLRGETEIYCSFNYLLQNASQPRELITMGGGPVSAKEKILIILPFPEDARLVEGLRKKFPESEVTYVYLPFRLKPGDEVPTLPKGMIRLRCFLSISSSKSSTDIYKDVTVLFTLSQLPPNKEEVPKLNLVHLGSAGTDRILQHPLFVDSDIVFTNSSGVAAPQIAEWVIFTALASRHGYNTFHDHQKAGMWRRGTEFETTVDAVGQRIGILGYGAIGRQGR
jgi:hypothetical protein